MCRFEYLYIIINFFIVIFIYFLEFELRCSVGFFDFLFILVLFKEVFCFVFKFNLY